MFTAPVVAAAALIAVRVLANRRHFLDALPRSQWLSAAGGVSVAYVCLHLLPEVAAVASQLAFWCLLCGLDFLHTLHRVIRRRGSDAGAATFWLSMSTL